MRMVQAPVHKKIEMVAVGDGFMSAVFAVLMLGAGRPTGITRSAGGWIPNVDGNGMLVKVVAVCAVKVSIVKVVHVSVVPDGGVPTAITVDVGMTFMNRMRHGLVSSLSVPIQSLTSNKDKVI